MATSSVLKKLYGYILANKTYLKENKLYPVLDKYTNKEVSRVCNADREAINEAIEIGSTVGEREMKALKPFQRSKILHDLAKGLEDNIDELANIIAIEAGKPINGARLEVSRGIDTCLEGAIVATEYSEQGKYFGLQGRESGIDTFCVTRRYPVGLLSFVTPFNFPLNLALHKIAPAIAAGCPFVLKPSERTPITALKLGEIMQEYCDLPTGSFSILPCDVEDASMFSEDKRIKMLSFTGSPLIGWKLKNTCGDKKIALELGGNAGVIIDDTVSNDVNDEKFKTMIQRLTFGSFFYAGQTCISVQKIFLHDNIYETVKSELIRECEKLNNNIGDPTDQKTLLGPLIDVGSANRIKSWIDEAVNDNANLLVGGSMINDNIIQATILENVSHNCNVWDKEIFGPVISLERFSDFETVINTANQTEFGLQTGLYTNDLKRAFYAYDNLECGGVVINDVSTTRIDSQPYGGIKKSGIGREGLKYAFEEFTEIKTLLLRDLKLN
eukprot:TRINITY_DN7354_c0_g1_i2.p1 TRINITY_DN7354_c0_g1~~TRINITY_DN7354_c0_g1_i2.p1  ORF type:complete len:499 (+),score=197.23 TRINITY_DN7354_c0_g1_i2:24-1520(+)